MIRIIGDGGHAAVVRDAARTLISGRTVVAVGNNADRKSEVGRQPEGTSYAVVIDPNAVVSDEAEIGDGTVVMAGAVVQARAKAGRHVILNSNSSTDHDCTIGDFSHIAPGAVLCGNVTVGEGALVGAGAVCLPGAVIEPWTTVKAGEVVKCNRHTK